MYDATDMIASPNQSTKGQTVRDTWNGKIRTLGTGSDFTAFQEFAGVPCIDMGFQPGPGDGLYHYHSNYDSFDWMDRYGDPGWHYHVTIAKTWALLATEFSESPILPFRAADYATALKHYFEAVPKQSFPLSTTSLSRSITVFSHAARALDRHADKVSRHLRGTPSWRRKAKLFVQSKVINDKYKVLEREFLHAPGLDGRPWFKHSIFAPGLWTG